MIGDGNEGTAPEDSFAPMVYYRYYRAVNMQEWTSDWYVQPLDESACQICGTDSVHSGMVSPEKYSVWHPPQSKTPENSKRRFISLCPELLFTLPADGTPAVDDRYGYESFGFPVYYQDKRIGIMLFQL